MHGVPLLTLRPSLLNRVPRISSSTEARRVYLLGSWLVGRESECVQVKEFVCTSPVSPLVLAELVYAHLESVTSKPPTRLHNISETRPSCQGQDSNESIMRINAIFAAWECVYLASAQAFRVSRTRLRHFMFAYTGTSQYRPDLRATCPAHLALERSTRCWETRGRFRAR